MCRDRIVNYSRLIRYAIVASTLLLSAILSFQVTQLLDPSLLLGVVAGLIGLLVIYRLGRFEHGIMAVALSAGLVNFFALPTGRESRVTISLALTLLFLGVWIIQMLLGARSGVRIRPSPLNKPLLAFVAINIVAYLWSMLLRDPFLYIWPSFPVVQLAALLVNISLPLITLLVANKIVEVKWLKYLVAILIGLGVLNIGSRLLNLPTLVLIDNGSRGLFSAWVAAFALALALFHRGLPRWQRVALLGLIAAELFYYFGLQRLWLSGWLPILVACCVVLFLYSRKLFAVAMVLGLIYVALNFDSYYKTIVSDNVDEGGLQRFNLWAMNLAHVANHPLFGMGPAGYAVYNMTYHPQDARSTHNNYFDILAQNGIVGIVSFVALLATLVWLGLRTRRMIAGQGGFENAFSAAVLGGLAAAIVAMALGDWVLPFAYNQTITGFDNAVFTWIFLGGMVSLFHILNTTHRAIQPDVR